MARDLINKLLNKKVNLYYAVTDSQLKIQHLKLKYFLSRASSKNQRRLKKK